MPNYQEIKTINNQSAPTKNQITNNKPNILKNSNVLQGYLGGSMNGGIIKPIAYVPVMAGTKIMEYRLRANIKMLTPKVPVYQKLKLVLKTFFVPHSRIWDNAEKFIAQKGGQTTVKIKEIPNLGGFELPTVTIENESDQNFIVPIVDTDLWRDSWVSAYIPRFQTGLSSQNVFHNLPKYSILPIRGFRAIYNDYLRNKEYEAELTEYKGDTVTMNEFTDTFFSLNIPDEYQKNIIRGRRQNSYYTDYRTELLGEDTEGENPLEEDGQSLLNLTEWEKTVAELRSEAENAQKNDWDIISEIRGSKKLTEGKVQLLSVKTVGLNYMSVPQTTYNTANDIQPEQQTLGAEGAYSFTEIDIPLIQMQEIIEEGTIHVIAQITADSVFETGFDRIGLNVGIFDIYRPDLIEQKEDVLFEIEKCGTRINSEEDLTKITGYKRKFSEYFKLPNIINGEITTAGYYKTKFTERNFNYEITEDLTRYPSQQAYQFFEQDDKETPRFMPKKIWKDYTDILINENLAIMEEVEEIKQGNTTLDLRVNGNNQVFFVGQHTLVASLPINENIKNNFTKWGEQ